MARIFAIIIYILSMVPDNVHCVAHIRASFIKTESSSLCDSKWCSLKLETCLESLSEDCKSHTAINMLGATYLLNFYFGATKFDSIVTSLPITLTLKVKGGGYNKLFEGDKQINSTSPDSTYHVNISKSGGHSLSFNVSFGDKDIRVEMIFYASCTVGSLGPLCHCPSGNVALSLKQIQAKPAAHCHFCEMAAKFCVSKVSGIDGVCEESSATVIQADEIYSYASMNSTKINIDLHDTLYIKLYLSRNISGSIQTDTHGPISYTMDSFGRFDLVAPVDFLSEDYEMVLQFNAECYTLGKGSESDCIMETKIDVVNVTSLNESERCLDNFCKLGIWSRLKMNDRVDTETLQLVMSENIVGSGDLLDFNFNYPAIAKFVHVFPVKFNIIMGFQFFYPPDFASERYEVDVKFAEKVDFHLEHFDILHKGLYYRVFLKFTMSRVNPSIKEQCLFGHIQMKNAVIEVKEDGKTKKCPAGPVCWLFLVVEEVIGSRGTVTGYTLFAKDFVEPEKDLIFHVESKRKTKHYTLPNTHRQRIIINIRQSRSLILRYRYDDTDSFTYIGESDTLSNDFQLSPSPNVSIHLRRETTSKCSFEMASLIRKGVCSSYKIRMTDITVTPASSVPAACSTVPCLDHMKICFSLSKPASEGECHSQSTVVFFGLTSNMKFPSSSKAYFSVEMTVAVNHSIGFSDIFEGSITIKGDSTENKIVEILNFTANSTSFQIELKLHKECVAGGKVCRDYDHRDCDIFRPYDKYYCSCNTSLSEYCPNMCGTCNECDKLPCLYPDCVISNFGCRRETKGIFYTPEQCQNMGVCGQDHHLCQLTFGGQNRFHPCHRCKYESYAKNICPITCGLCPEPCNGMKCQNGGKLNIKDCTCKCPSLFSGDHCQNVDCPPESENQCDWPLWFCQTFWIPKQCAKRCGLC